jgi:predicted nucleotidyltransferase
MYGLLDTDIDYILRALKYLDEIEHACIFGSRAMGNFKKGSDVDLVISGKGVTSETLYKLDNLLNEEFPLPYFFDILKYEDVSNEKLKEHIDSIGILIYQKGKTADPPKRPDTNR